MLGQTKFEFIFTVVIFAIIIFFAISQINILFTAIKTDAETDVSKSIATNAIVVLLEDRGDPPDWETDPPNAQRVGLAIKPYFLSRQKIQELNNRCDLLDNYNLKGYYLEILNSTQVALSCGYNMTSAPSAVVFRHILIEGDIGNVTLKVW